MPSESPKWIALVLSLIAITISGLSWWESHRGRLTTEEVNRPVLSLSSIETDAGGERITGNPDIPLTFVVKLKNTGRVTGRITKAEVRPFSHSADPLCKTYPPPGGGVDSLNLQEMLVGVEEPLLGTVLVTKGCLDIPATKFVISVTVSYVDVSSGTEYFQAFIENNELNWDQLKAKAKSKYGTDLESWAK